MSDKRWRSSKHPIDEETQKALDGIYDQATPQVVALRPDTDFLEKPLTHLQDRAHEWFFKNQRVQEIFAVFEQLSKTLEEAIETLHCREQIALNEFRLAYLNTTIHE